MGVHPLHEGRDLVRRIRRLAVDGAEHRQIRAHAEILLVVGGEHDRTRFGVITEDGERGSQVLHQVLGDRVVAFATHDDTRDRAFPPDLD